MPKRILILCTGNSCRSQMAEGILKSFDSSLEVYSAGTFPEKRVNPYAIKVMNEIGVDISGNCTKSVEQFSSGSFDFVITVCDNAREACPLFTGNVGKSLHMGFADPAVAKGSAEEIIQVYRKVRDEIKERFYFLYIHQLK